MKLIKKLSIVFLSLTVAFMISTGIITCTYTSVAKAQTAELITNGGFEVDPLVDPNNSKKNNPNVTGWAKSGDTLNTSLSTIDNFPHTGNQGLSLGGFTNISYISQTIPTIPNQDYLLTYYLASTEQSPALDNEFQTFVGGRKISDLINVTFQPYTQYQFKFSAEGTSTQIKFGSVAKHNFLYLDDVSVQPRDF